MHLISLTLISLLIAIWLLLVYIVHTFIRICLSINFQIFAFFSCKFLKPNSPPSWVAISNEISIIISIIIYDFNSILFQPGPYISMIFWLDFDGFYNIWWPLAFWPRFYGFQIQLSPWFCWNQRERDLKKYIIGSIIRSLWMEFLLEVCS